LTVANIVNSVYGKVYTIASGTISNTFNGLAEGATFTVSGVTLQISYAGNKVTLTDVTGGGNWFLLQMRNAVYNSMTGTR
jgi:hypothetical protein